MSRCINALQKVEPELLSHTIVIDDGSTHPSATKYYALLKEKFPGIRILFNSENLGYAKTINKGLLIAELSDYDWVITLNNDVEMLTSFTKRISLLGREFPKITAIGAKLLYPSGKIQHAGFEVISNNEKSLGFMKLHDRNNYDLIDPGSSNTPRFMQGVTGAFQVLRVKHLPVTGLYSEKYYLAYEDVEFCLRIWKSGFEIFYDPYIEGVHYEGATRGDGMTPAEVKSRAQFFSDLASYSLDEIGRSVGKANSRI